MKYTIALIACIFLYAQCQKPKSTQYATTTTDTLGIKWMTIERNNITYCFQGAMGLDEASRFTDQHEEAYTTIDKVFKAQLPHKLRFFIWTDTALARLLLSRPAGFAEPLQCICYIRTNQTRGHEMTHILSYWAGGIPPTKTTKFINEGVAVAFDLNAGNKVDIAKKAASGKGIHNIIDLWSGSYPATEEVLYPVAGAFVEFLYKQNLPDQFSALIRNQTIESAETIYGKAQFDKLVADFNALIAL